MTTIHLNQSKEFMEEVNKQFHGLISKDEQVRKGLDGEMDNAKNTIALFYAPKKTNPSDFNLILKEMGVETI